MSDIRKWKAIIESASKIIESEEEYTDHEVSMAKSQLLSSVKSATRIAKQLQDKSEEEGLEGWVASKLTMAEDYLQAVADHMDGQEINEGYKVMPPMDPKYVARKGLEGPFTTLSGKVVYYDPKEGKYYDPDTDMYISYEDFRVLDNEYSSMKESLGDVEFGMFTKGGNAQVENAIQYILNDFEDAAEKATNSDRDSLRMNAFRKLSNELEALSNEDGYEEAMDTEVRERSMKYLDKGIIRIMNVLDKKPIGEESVNEAGGYYTQPVYDMIKQHGYEKVMHELLTSLHADVIQDFLQRADLNEAGETKYGIVRYPDTAISYIKNDGNGWEHIFDKSYGFEGPVDKADLKHAKKIAKEKIPSRMFEAKDTCECGCECGKDVCESCGKKHSVNESQQMMTEAQFDEAAGEKDACYRKVKSRYKVWPSAYASGALVKCRKVGASNWGNSKK